MKFVRDPTSEASETMRPPKALPDDITGKTIALLNISKERSEEFLDQLVRSGQLFIGPAKLRGHRFGQTDD